MDRRQSAATYARGRAAFLALGIVCAVLAPPLAGAQDIPLPSFLDRDGGLFGGEPRQPGAYVSPSANDLVPKPGDVGVAPSRGLQRFDPIALPSSAGKPILPSINLPGLPAYAPQNMPSLDRLQNRQPLTLEARLTASGETVPNGLVWRLFSALPAPDGKPVLMASSEGNVANFQVAPGSYVLHVGFGRAGIVKRIEFSGLKTKEVVVLNAGGLKLDATVGGDSKIDRKLLKFNVYGDDDEDESTRNLIASDVPADKVLRLNAGTYHVVSNYGSVNALVRADIRVEAGKVTTATLEQHAALLTMKLVREKGGEAIADTAWSVTTTSGDPVRESVGAFPSMVLAAGDYVISARNRDKVYQRQFTVETGHDSDVEVLTSDVAPDDGALEGSGD